MLASNAMAGLRVIRPSALIAKDLLERLLHTFSLPNDYDINVCIVRAFPKILEEVGLPSIRFHDLRHSAATLLRSMGVDIKLIQEILGHSNFMITADIYSHMLPSQQKEAANKWDDEFRGSQKEGS